MGLWAGPDSGILRLTHLVEEAEGVKSTVCVVGRILSGWGPATWAMGGLCSFKDYVLKFLLIFTTRWEVDWLLWECFAQRRGMNILLALQGQTRSQAQGCADGTMKG